MTDTEPAVKLQLMSHSRRSGWLRCANQLRLRKGGYPVKPSVALIAGTAFHSTCDDIDWNFWEDIPTGPSLCESYWHENFQKGVAEAQEVEPDISKWTVSGRYSKARPLKENVEAWAEMGEQFAKDYLAYRSKEVARGLDIWTIPGEPGEAMPAIEVPFAFEILPGVIERGYIDRIMVQGDTYMIRDLKTSARVPSDKSQLGLYRVGVQKTYGIDAVWGDYFMARQGAPSEPFNLSHFTEEYFAEQDRMVAGAMARNEYPANPGDICSYCDCRNACAAVGGPEADAWRFVLPR